MGTYGITSVTERSFEETVDLVVAALQNEGFGVLTDIDVKNTLHDKLGVNIPKYRILGACNPPYAYAALKAEDLAGVFLPCNVVVHELREDEIEVTAIDPVAATTAVTNPRLQAVAWKIKERLEQVMAQIEG